MAFVFMAVSYPSPTQQRPQTAKNRKKPLDSSFDNKGSTCLNIYQRPLHRHLRESAEPHYALHDGRRSGRDGDASYTFHLTNKEGKRKASTIETHIAYWKNKLSQRGQQRIKGVNPVLKHQSITSVETSSCNLRLRASGVERSSNGRHEFYQVTLNDFKFFCKGTLQVSFQTAENTTTQTSKQ